MLSRVQTISAMSQKSAHSVAHVGHACTFVVNLGRGHLQAGALLADLHDKDLKIPPTTQAHMPLLQACAAAGNSDLALRFLRVC